MLCSGALDATHLRFRRWYDCIFQGQAIIISNLPHSSHHIQF